MYWLPSILYDYGYSWKSIFYLFFYMSCVYLNIILPGIRYGQTTFTILKTYKLSMPDISSFSIKYDNSVTNNTFPIEILREKNHKKNHSNLLYLYPIYWRSKAFEKKQWISGIDLGWISTLIYSFHHTSDFCGFLASYKQKSHISGLITIYAKIKIDWETLNMLMWSSTILHVDVLIHFRQKTGLTLIFWKTK